MHSSDCIRAAPCEMTPSLTLALRTRLGLAPLTLSFPHGSSLTHRSVWHHWLRC